MPVPKQLRRTARWMLVLVALSLSACGHAPLVHHDGTPFVEQRPRLALDHGWIAVDSCAAGHHALLELEVEGVASFPILPRWFNTAPLGTLRDYRVGGPWCRTDYYGFFEQDYDEEPGRWASDTYGAQRRCIYVVRAEYTLAEPPAAADSVFLADLRAAVSRSHE